MSKKLVKLADLSHDQWLEWRRKGIGGSDAATVVGLNPYMSLYELWADKQGLLPEKEDTEAMRVGRDLEQYVADRFCETTGKKVQKLPYMYCHDSHPFIAANIDRKVVGENAALECKTTSIFNKSDFENGQVPSNYLCQCYHYMNVMGYDKMYLAVLILGKGFFWYEIKRNKAQQEALLKAEIDFWNKYIIGNSIPAPDGSDGAGQALAAVYGADNGETVSLMHIDKKLEYYAKLRENVDNLLQEKSKIEQEIKQEIGNAAAGMGTDFKISWKNQSRNFVDSKLLKEKYPEIYSECLKSSQSRVFRFTEIRKD